MQHAPGFNFESGSQVEVSHMINGSNLVYSMPSQFMSQTIPAKALDWLCTDMSLSAQKFKSFKNFQSAGKWPHGIVNINTDLLESLDLPADRVLALRDGFDLGLNELPPVQNDKVENYSSLDKYGDLVEQKLMKDVEKGVIELFDFDEKDRNKYWFHPLGAVPKGDSDCRIIVDTSATGLNDVIIKTEMKLPNIRSIINSCYRGIRGCTFDLTAGFHQLKLKEDMPNFVCITFPSGKKGRYRVLCFGLACAPFLFQGTMMELREVLLAKGILKCPIFVYIDDWTLLDTKDTPVEISKAEFIRVLTEAGFALHPDKMSEISTQISTIGFLIDSINLTLSFPQDRLSKRLAFIKDTLLSPPKTLGDLRQISGKLTHLSTVVLGSRFFVKPWWKWIADETKLAIAHRTKLALKTHQPTSISKVSSSTKLKCTNSFISECNDSLHWFLNVLSSNDSLGIPLIEKSDGFFDIFDPLTISSIQSVDWKLSPINMGISSVVEITSDASSTGGGFWWSSSYGNSDECEFIWHIGLAFQSSNMRELLTAIVAIKQLATHSFTSGNKHKLVWVRTDNTATIGCLNKFTSSSQSLQHSIFQIANDLHARKICVATIHIPGKANDRADNLSRRNGFVYDKLKPSKALMKFLRSVWTSNNPMIVWGPSSSTSNEQFWQSEIIKWKSNAHWNFRNDILFVILPNPLTATSTVKDFAKFINRHRIKNAWIIIPHFTYQYKDKLIELWGPVKKVTEKRNFLLNNSIPLHSPFQILSPIDNSIADLKCWKFVSSNMNSSIDSCKNVNMFLEKCFTTGIKIWSFSYAKFIFNKYDKAIKSSI